MAIVFNIQRFSVHDGPGIRTTVFLKGCNLACRWCHNPESIRGEPQIQFFEERCTGCGLCAKSCPSGALARGHAQGRDCRLCGNCADVCMADARKLTGQAMTPEQAMEIVRRDKAYYANSGGGLTVSGGEPLLQADFCAKLFRLAQGEGIHTALDTAGNVPYEAFEKVLPYTDAVLFDLKLMDDGRHREYTGVSNVRILENAQRLFGEDVALHIRIPVVGGVNDTVENARAAARFIGGAKLAQIKLLPYHNLGQSKAKSAGAQQQAFTTPGADTLRRLAAEFDGPVV